jgi:hypothetical protein
VERRRGEPLDGGDARDDDPRPAHLAQQRLHEGRPGGRPARDGQQPGRERPAVRPGQLLVAVGSVQAGELLVAGRAAPGEAGEAVRRDADLLRDEPQRLGGDELAGPE